MPIQQCSVHPWNQACYPDTERDINMADMKIRGDVMLRQVGIRKEVSRGTRAGACTPPRTSTLDDADASLCCFALCHAGKELLRTLSHFCGAQILFMCGDAPRIAKGVCQSSVAVAPELVGHGH
jgi:hypothetical protein